MPVKSIIAIVAVTAGSFFALGAYYQHQDVMRNIKRLEQRNPHAYFIRRKLYAMLSLFKVNADSRDYDDDDEVEKHKLGGIMKYGFPSMNDITLNETFNFVSSFDRRNSSIHWMCERVEMSDSLRNSDYQPIDLRQRSVAFPLTNNALGQSEAARVFFMSNIKPFVNRGFNLKVWQRLLSYVQEVSDLHGVVYVYTGSIYLPRELKMNNWYVEFQPEDNTMVAVPTHFFKIIVMDPKYEPNAKPYAEAYVVPNTTMNDGTELKSLLSDVRDIEEATGLRFFEGLDRNFISNQVGNSTTLNLEAARLNE